MTILAEDAERLPPETKLGVFFQHKRRIFRKKLSVIDNEMKYKSSKANIHQRLHKAQWFYSKHGKVKIQSWVVFTIILQICSQAQVLRSKLFGRAQPQVSSLPEFSTSNKIQ